MSLEEQDDSVVHEFEQIEEQAPPVEISLTALLELQMLEAEFKALGPKIGSSGKPGVGKDGDGDGLCNESFGVGVPCMPSIPDVPIWSAAQKARLQKRRSAIARFKDRKRSKANFSFKDLFDAKKSGKDKEVEELIGQIFNHDGLGQDGKYKSRVTSVGYSGLETGANNYFKVDGEFYDEDGNLVGSFQRAIMENGFIDHGTLSMDDGTGEIEKYDGKADYRGLGIGGDFLLESQEKYGDIGIDGINVIAVSQGAYQWAVDGYDWANEFQRTKFLKQMRRVLDDNEKDWLETKEERELFQQLLEKALSEDFDDENRVTPYLFTLFPKSKDFMTAFIKGKDDLLPERLNWAGRRPVRTIPKSLVSALEAEIKALGTPIGGIGRDGDGDGLCNESRGVGVPCPPGVPNIPLWSKIQQRRLDKRRSTIERFKNRERKTVSFTHQDIWAAQENGDTETVKRMVKDIFNHNNLGEDGKYKSVVRAVRENRDIIVEGQILNEKNEPVGYFQRNIARNGTIYHSVLNLKGDLSKKNPRERTKFKNKGIGSDFILESQQKYADIGVPEIFTTTDEDGNYHWAVDGYDWENKKSRDRFLENMRIVLEDPTKNWFPNNDERELFKQVLEKAESEDFDDKNRVTPYVFTLFTNARGFMSQFLTEQQTGGRVGSLWWDGKKRPQQGLPRREQGSVVGSLKEILGDDVESVLGETQQKRLDTRRKVIDRRKERGKIANPPTVKMLRDSAENGYEKNLEVYGAPIFEFDGLGVNGNATAKITKINVWGATEDEQGAGIPPSVYYTGDYLNKSGKQIGTFSYTLRLDPVDGKMVVEHEHVSISKKHRGTGIGSDHQLLVEEQLSKMGFEEMRLLATMENGAYNWAVDGYDWENQTQKAKFLTHMQQILDDTKNEWFETKEERELFAKLIAEAQKQKSASPKRVTPYHFTLFPRAKEFMTKPLNWYGTRPIRKSPIK
jgi:hypothetical protein